jgi:hypothetical protein
MHRLAFPLRGLALAVLCASANAAPQRKVLSGSEIKKTFTEKVATDGVHWACPLGLLLKPRWHACWQRDGAQASRSIGHQHHRLCLSTPLGAPEKCRTVVRLDGNLVFRRDGVDAMDVTVEKFSSKYRFD